MRTRAWLVPVLVLAFPTLALAHLCNDSFAQAKDNLAVKVDIRDGQLRIGKEASFRVYLLDTSDRGWAGIALEVKSNEFTATSQPSPEWRTYPRLMTVAQGGKKEYFTVTLQRKAGVPDGKYKIELALVHPQTRTRVAKSVDLDAAADICALPKAAGIKVDGQAAETEWAQSYVCANFYTYVPVSTKMGQFHENRPAAEQARVRLACDSNNLYCLVNFQGGTPDDLVTLYVAPSTDAKPVALTIERATGKVTGNKPTEGVVVKTGADLVECQIPRALLGIKDVKAFYANFTRTAVSGQ